jgi:hypothetical protein
MTAMPGAPGACPTSRQAPSSGPLETVAASRSFCSYEDRESHLPGVEVLAASLLAHHPDIPLNLYRRPNATWVDSLRRFANVQVHTFDFPDNITGYSVKPLVIDAELRHYDETIWIDTDIVLTGPLRLPIADRCDVLVIAEEPKAVAQPWLDKSTPWGLRRGRMFQNSVNSCIVRATRHHVSLMQHWARLLNTSIYHDSQQKPWDHRPIHALTDQDVLEGLLCSHEYQHVPVHFLRAGKDIAQCFRVDGYSFTERLLGWRRLPPLVHCQGWKPWITRGPERPLWLDVSPYNYAARRFAEALSGDPSWMYPTSRTGKLLNAFFCGNPALVGMPPALWRLICSTIAFRTRLRRLRDRLANVWRRTPGHCSSV